MNIFELFGSIAINNRDANSALKDTTDKAERAGAQIQKAFKGIGSATMKVGKMVVDGGKMVIAGGAAAATAFVGAVEGSREYRESMAKLDAAFYANGHSSETALKTYRALQAILGETDQSVEAANHLAVLCDNEEDLLKWTEICTGVFATFNDSLPIEGLTEAINHTAQLGEVQGPLADALEWVGWSTEDFNKQLAACLTTEERQKLIMDTLYNSYRAAGERYKETAGDVMKANNAQDKLNASLAKIGAIGEPILTGLKSWVADMVTAAVPHIETLVTKLVNFDTTMENDIWPWFQKQANMIFGIELPDFPTLKATVSTKWEEFKTSAAEFLKLKPGMELPDGASFIDRLTAWWNGQGDNVYEKVKNILKWTLGEFVAPPLEALGTWWNSEGGGEDKLYDLLCWTIGEFVAPAIADVVTTTGQTIAEWAKEFIDGVVMLLDWTLGELGLPTVTEVAGKINAWWQEVLKEISLTLAPTLERFEVNQNVNENRESNIQAATGYLGEYAYGWGNDYITTDVVPEVAEGSEEKVQGEIDSMNLSGTVKINPDMSAVNAAIGGGYLGEYAYGWGNDYYTGNPDSSNAVGLDRVPRDGYLARVHKDEAILDKTDADIWRGGGTSKIEALLAQLVANTMGGQMVVLDTGAMVGQLAPMMDAKLGTISNRRGRGN